MKIITTILFLGVSFIGLVKIKPTIAMETPGLANSLNLKTTESFRNTNYHLPNIQSLEVNAPRSNDPINYFDLKKLENFFSLKSAHIDPYYESGTANGARLSKMDLDYLYVKGTESSAAPLLLLGTLKFSFSALTEFRLENVELPKEPFFSYLPNSLKVLMINCPKSKGRISLEALSALPTHTPNLTQLVVSVRFKTGDLPDLSGLPQLNSLTLIGVNPLIAPAKPVVLKSVLHIISLAGENVTIKNVKLEPQGDIFEENSRVLFLDLSYNPSKRIYGRVELNIQRPPNSNKIPVFGLAARRNHGDIRIDTLVTPESSPVIPVEYIID